MFEAVISQVKTGRVTRRMFETRDEAERYLVAVEELLVNPLPRWDKRTEEWKQPKPKSMREYRMEILFCERPVVMPVPSRRGRKAMAA